MSFAICKQCNKSQTRLPPRHLLNVPIWAYRKHTAVTMCDWNMPFFYRTCLHKISKHCLIPDCCTELVCLNDQALQWMLANCSLCVQTWYFYPTNEGCGNYQSLLKTTKVSSQMSRKPSQFVNACSNPEAKHKPYCCKQKGLKNWFSVGFLIKIL